MGKIIVSTACFIFNNGKYLLSKRLSKHYNGYYSVPGGKVDFGELPSETIIREVKEETNITLDSVIPLNIVASHSKGDDQYLCFWFSAPLPRNMDADISFIETDKNGNPKTEKWTWFSSEEMEKLQLFPNTLKVLTHEDLGNDLKFIRSK